MYAETARLIVEPINITEGIDARIYIVIGGGEGSQGTMFSNDMNRDGQKDWHDCL